MTALFLLRTRRRQTSCGVGVFMLLAIMSAGVFYARASGEHKAIQKLNSFVQATRPDTPAARALRAGRDQIEAENWQQAVAGFQDFVREHPKNKDVDAALYWLAYALKKQGKKDEAKPPLLRVIREFPKSSWANEAKAMLVELGFADEARVVLDAQRGDNENCEMKILALQSLFEADEEKAFNFVSELLKNPSPSCPALRTAGVSLLGGHGGPRAVPILLDIALTNPDLKLRLTAIKRLGEQESDAITHDLARLFDTDRTQEVRKQILRAFAEMHSPGAEAKLVETARSGDDPVIRQYAIRYLGEHHGGASLEALISIYDSDKTPEIRMQILKALSERIEPAARAKLLNIARHGETSELRVAAIRRSVEHGGMAVTDLWDLYNAETNEAIKLGVLRAFGEMEDPRAREKLYEVARSTLNTNLRLSAIRVLANSEEDPQVATELVKIYDAEQNVEVRAALIRAFGESEDKVAVRKLIAIARGDSSVDLRKLAVRMLGESRDPEAMKFLDELLK
jgi:HEAT repeat protein